VPDGSNQGSGTEDSTVLGVVVFGSIVLGVAALLVLGVIVLSVVHVAKHRRDGGAWKHEKATAVVVGRILPPRVSGEDGGAAGGRGLASKSESRFDVLGMNSRASTGE